MKLKKGVTVYKGGKKYTVEVPAGVLPEKPPFGHDWLR